MLNSLFVSLLLLQQQPAEQPVLTSLIQPVGSRDKSNPSSVDLFESQIDLLCRESGEMNALRPATDVPHGFPSRLCQWDPQSPPRLDVGARLEVGRGSYCSQSVVARFFLINNEKQDLDYELSEPPEFGSLFSLQEMKSENLKITVVDPAGRDMSRDPPRGYHNYWQSWHSVLRNSETQIAFSIAEWAIFDEPGTYTVKISQTVYFRDPSVDPSFAGLVPSLLDESVTLWQPVELSATATFDYTGWEVEPATRSSLVPSDGLWDF